MFFAISAKSLPWPTIAPRILSASFLAACLERFILNPHGRHLYRRPKYGRQIPRQEAQLRGCHCFLRRRTI